MRTSYTWGFFFCVQNSASYTANMHIHSGRQNQKNTMKAFTVSKYRTSVWPSKPSHPLQNLQRTSEAEAISVSLRPFSKKAVSWIKELKLLTTRTPALAENGTEQCPFLHKHLQPLKWPLAPEGRGAVYYGHVTEFSFSCCLPEVPGAKDVL